MASSSPAADPNLQGGSGLTGRDQLIVITVCTVVGASALGVLLGLLLCHLRRKRLRAGFLASETSPVRDLAREKSCVPHRAFPQWNGRRNENYAPLDAQNEKPAFNRHNSGAPDESRRNLWRSSNGLSPTTPSFYHPNYSNPYIPEPAPTLALTRPLAQHTKHTMAPSLGAIAGAATARQQARHQKARSYDSLYNNSSSQRQPLSRGRYSQERLPTTYERQQSHVPTRYGNTTYVTTQNSPTNNRNSYGFGGYVDAYRDQYQQPTFEPPPLTPLSPGREPLSYFNSKPIAPLPLTRQYQPYSPAPAPIAPAPSPAPAHLVSRFSDSMISSPIDEQRASLLGRETLHERRVKSPARELTLIQPRPKRGSTQAVVVHSVATDNGSKGSSRSNSKYSQESPSEQPPPLSPLASHPPSGPAMTAPASIMAASALVSIPPLAPIRPANTVMMSSTDVTTTTASTAPQTSEFSHKTADTSARTSASINPNYAPKTPTSASESSRGRMSFSRPRPKKLSLDSTSVPQSPAYIPVFYQHNRDESRELMIPPPTMLPPGMAPLQPPVTPWDLGAEHARRTSSESSGGRRSFGPDGKPRRLRASDLVDEDDDWATGAVWGVGVAI